MSDIDKRHGGPFDRGGADSYYHRGMNPHYFKGPTYASELVEEHDMTDDEIAEYNAGYAENERFGDKKEWE
tara:strand:+ start:305 stop:517 length:213 start_codon:yes stop_codon:yes gene_type:complete